MNIIKRLLTLFCKKETKYKMGFTLVELIVTLAIMGIVATSIFSLFIFGTKAFKNGETDADKQYQIRMAADYITKHVRYADTAELLSTAPDISSLDSNYYYIFIESGTIKSYKGSQLLSIAGVQGINDFSLELKKATGSNNNLQFTIDKLGTTAFKVTTDVVLLNVGSTGISGSVGAAYAGIKYTLPITVAAVNIPVLGVSLPASETITVNNTKTLTATLSPSNASDTTVSWSSDNALVATVNSSGVVTGKQAGEATITVTTHDGGYQAQCTVTVTVQPVSGVSLADTAVSIGSTKTLNAVVLPTDASDKTVMWNSDNTSVATVDSSGVVTGNHVGTAIITVTTRDGGHQAQCIVTVVGALALNDPGTSVIKKQTYIYEAKALGGMAPYSYSFTGISAEGDSPIVTGNTIKWKSPNGNGKKMKFTITVSDSLGQTISKSVEVTTN